MLFYPFDYGQSDSILLIGPWATFLVLAIPVVVISDLMPNATICCCVSIPKNRGYN